MNRPPKRCSHVSCLLLAVFSLLVSSIPVCSQQPLVGLIQGKIVDQNQAPIPYALLTATDIDHIGSESPRRTTGADAHGFYQFVNVPKGRYSILVKKGG